MQGEFDSLRRFSGGPQPLHRRLWQVLRPHGGAVTDGLRLAALNVGGIISGLAMIGLGRVLDWLLPLPFIFSAFAILVVLVAVTVVFWYRYASTHGRVARARGREVRPDVFGGVAAMPFAGLGIFLVGTGAIELLLALISFSARRAGEAIVHLGWGAMFLALVVVVVVVARAAAE